MDKKDKKLCYELDINSRQPYQKIAKKLKISKDSVIYRVKNLQKNKLIKSFNSVINVGSLGYVGFRLLLKFYNITPKKEEEIISFLLSNKNLGWVVSIEGAWDLNTYFYYKSVKEMDLFYQEFIKKFRNHIEKRNLSIYSKIIGYSRNYLMDSKKREKITIYESKDEIKTDKKDIIILKELSDDARTSILDLARKTNLTSKTVIKKIRDLEKKKIITGYRTEFNLDQLGYQYYKLHITLFNSTEEEIKKLQSFLRESKNVVYEDIMLGGFDLEFELQFKNTEELREFINEMKQKHSHIIKDYEILHYFKEHRLRFYPFM
jgi:Lrp/AsnC family transcriptional regulator, leucine-responsive regulatory protein